jgi:hypothetical protein
MLHTIVMHFRVCAPVEFLEFPRANHSASQFQEGRTWPRELLRKENKLARQCKSGIKQRETQ